MAVGDQIKFHVGTLAEYNAKKTAGTLVAGDFYFTTDTKEMYIGANKYCEAYKLVDEFPEEGVQQGVIYINKDTYEAKIWDGTQWQEVSPAIVDTIALGTDDEAVPNVGAVRTFVAEQIGGAAFITSVDDTASVDLSVSSGALTADVNITATQGNVTLSVEDDGLKAEVAEASTTAKGIIQLATDAEAAAGTDEAKAINAKQLNDVVDGAVADKIELTDLSIASGSANYLEYDSSNGQFGAKVDTTVGAVATNLVTSGAVKTAIDNALVGAMVYKGTWDSTDQADYSGIVLPVKAGYMYLVTGSGCTIGGVEWRAGDYLVINKDVDEDEEITSNDVNKIDNTEASDIVRLNATQTLTNKTLDADSNTISNLETDNFKSGVVQTTVRASASASDTALASEKAIATAIEAVAESVDDVTIGRNADDELEVKDGGLTVAKMNSAAVATAISTSAVDTKLATEKAVADAIDAAKLAWTSI